MIVHVEVQELGSAVSDPRVASELMDAIALPSDMREFGGRSSESILGLFDTGIAQANIVFRTLKARMAKREEEYQALRTRCLESERREAVAADKFQAFVKESAEEYRLLQEELVRANGSLKRSEEEARQSAETIKALRARCKNSEDKQDQLEKDLARAKDLGVAEFKTSDEFADMLSDVTFPMFFNGFDDCKEKVTELYPGLDLSALVSKFGSKEEILGGGDEEVDEAEEEDLQEKSQEDPAPQKEKAASADVGGTAGPSSGDHLPVAPEDLELPDV